MLKMCMDGTTSIRDSVTGTAFTMAGTPTTASLLGVVAPTISATAYTSCTIPTATIGMTAGMAMSIVCVVNTPWDGTSAATHMLFAASGTAAAANRLRMLASAGSLYALVSDAANVTYYKYGAINATNWAASANHVCIMTRASDGTIMLYLDGAGLTSVSGTRRTEAAVNANLYVGTNIDGTFTLEGPILTAIYNRVLSTGEITSISTMTNWSSLFSSDPNNLAGSAFITGHRISGYRIGPTNVGI